MLQAEHESAAENEQSLASWHNMLFISYLGVGKTCTELVGLRGTAAPQETIIGRPVTERLAVSLRAASCI